MIGMRKLVVFVLTFICNATINAQIGKKIKGNGNVVTIQRRTAEYDGIRMDGFYKVKLRDGTVGELTIKGEENILEHIETKVKNGKLVILPLREARLIPSQGNTVYITIPIDEISSILLAGSADVDTEKTIKTNHLELQVSGSGNIRLAVNARKVSIATSGSSALELNGKAGNLDIISSGSSNINTYNLKASNANLSVSGSSEIRVAATELLNSLVSGSGHILYRGNPERLNSWISGSGSVSKD